MELELWDGNVMWTLPPGTNWVDARTMRDFPQNQEVFLGPLDRGDAFMCDLMECVGATTPSEALQEHWLGLLENNEAQQVEPVHIFAASISDPVGSQKVSIPCLVGKQEVGGVITTIWLAVIRIPSVRTDVVITWNQPPAATSHDSQAQFQAVLSSIRWVDISFMAQ
jgi:hypothetical protein